MAPTPRIIAHRGSPRAAPENTLASFRQAAREGARWVEFDAALTADARPVVFHDDTLERTTDGAGALDDALFEAVKALDAGSWFSKSFAGEMIPTLEEALELFADLGIGFNMEIKPARGREAETATVALHAAQLCWRATAPVPMISSFSRTAVAMAKDLMPAWPRSMLFDRVADDWREIGAQLGVSAFGASQRHLTQDTVEAMRGAGYAVTTYTVNEIERAQTLFSWGIDAIFTDVPGLMIQAFGQDFAAIKP